MGYLPPPPSSNHPSHNGGMLAAEQHPVGRKLDNAFVTPRIVRHRREEFTLGLDLPSRVRCLASNPANTVYTQIFHPKILPSHPLKHASYQTFTTPLPNRSRHLLSLISLPSVHPKLSD